MMTEQDYEEMDLFEQASKDERQAVEDAYTIRSRVTRLFEDQDFKWLTATMQASLDSRVGNTILTGISSFNDLVKKASEQAEIRGFQAAMLFAQSLLNGAQGTIDKHEAQKNRNE